MKKIASPFLAVFLIVLSFGMIQGCLNQDPNRAAVQRLSDLHQIQNIMSRHAWYYSSGQHARELNELFAMNEPDVSWGNGREWWVGRELLTNYYVTYFDEFRLRDLKEFAASHPEVDVTPENLGAGSSMFHTNSTPVIEVAEDGKTAKGIWYSIGQVTQTPGGKQTPVHMWERYGVDFINIDGEWKIWHFLVITDWAAGPGESWAADQQKNPFGPPPTMDADGHGNDAAQKGGQAGEMAGAPKPNVVVNTLPVGKYAPPSEVLFVPQPYRTFSETVSYGPPAEKP